MRSWLAGALCATLALAACNGSNSSSLPSGNSSVPQTAGDYTGTVNDSVMGAGTATVTLSQTGSSIGGTLVETFTGSTMQTSLALVTDLSGNVSGNAVATIGTGACGFKVAGTYGTSTGVLSGSYTAFSGCGGQTATFTLTQQCTNPTSSIRRRDGAHGIAPC